MGVVIVGRKATLPFHQSYRRKLLDGLVTSLALELTLATKLLNSLNVTLTRQPGP